MITIEELATKARTSVPEGLVVDEWVAQYNRIFAELILKECLDLCYHRGMNDSLYEGQLKAAEYIENHFGIKTE
jgi:hypothetical protein